jgi:hypothetical protein
LFKPKNKGAKDDGADPFLGTRIMLKGLGLERYEKNFKKNELWDSTLSLLNDE